MHEYILGCIRAGLAFQIKERIGYSIIAKKEEELVKLVQNELVLKHFNKFDLLGPSLEKVKRIPTFSFLIRAPKGNRQRHLHPNFVAALLNDLYGIQVRSGCFCASIYSMPILGLSKEAILENEAVLSSGKNKELLRFAATRFSLPYFTPQEEVQYVIDSLKQVCEYGWKLLPFYTPSYSHATWIHKSVKSPLQQQQQPPSPPIDLLFYNKSNQKQEEKKKLSFSSILQRNLQNNWKHGIWRRPNKK